MRSRPHLFTSYADEQAMLPTTTQRVLLGLLVLGAVLAPFQLIPGLQWMGSNEWLNILTRALIFAIGALGLNLLTGLAGQVSLGNAFFMAVGAYTAVVLGAPASENLLGFDLPMWIWLPAAGIVPAVVGILVSPAAVRVRGLYLAFVTIALVFIGEHVWRNARAVSGGPGLGRDWPPLELQLWRGEPIIDFSSDSTWFGIEVSAAVKTYFLMLVLLVAFTLIHKNLARTRTGRAFASIRDRDIAAEVMGVNEFRSKMLAFALSSFFAGICGALLAASVGRFIPESWNLLLSVQFIAIILIGGAGTTAGPLLGAFFVVCVPRTVELATRFLAEQATEPGLFGAVSNLLISTGTGDVGLISTQSVGPGLSIFQFNLVLYGLLIILFLIFEPLGLYGIWVRIRNYWKGWPFTY